MKQTECFYKFLEFMEVLYKMGYDVLKKFHPIFLVTLYIILVPMNIYFAGFFATLGVLAVLHIIVRKSEVR